MRVACNLPTAKSVPVSASGTDTCTQFLVARVFFSVFFSRRRTRCGRLTSKTVTKRRLPPRPLKEVVAPIVENIKPEEMEKKWFETYIFEIINPFVLSFNVNSEIIWGTPLFVCKNFSSLAIVLCVYTMRKIFFLIVFKISFLSNWKEWEKKTFYLT